MTATYVYLADTVLEYGVPDPGTVEYSDWATGEPNDTYHALTWKVLDLAQVERHLESQGVVIRAKSETMIITNPRRVSVFTWGFTTSLTTGDPRAE